MAAERDRLRLHARRAVFAAYRRQKASEWVEARGGSMRPLIVPGTWMLVEFGARPQGLGEIVLFPLREALVAHRVVARRGSGHASVLVTKGDAEPYCDPPLGAVDVIGVVRALRHGPGGPEARTGLAGRAAGTIARISRWSGRAAALGRRTAPLLPDPLRRGVLRVIPPLARVATQLAASPLAWVAWNRTTNEEGG